MIDMGDMKGGCKTTKNMGKGCSDFGVGVFKNGKSSVRELMIYDYDITRNEGTMEALL